MRSEMLQRSAAESAQLEHNMMDTLGIEPRASRMLSGCDTTTPRARDSEVFAQIVELPHAVARQLRGGRANLQSKSSSS